MQLAHFSHARHPNVVEGYFRSLEWWTQSDPETSNPSWFGPQDRCWAFLPAARWLRWPLGLPALEAEPEVWHRGRARRSPCLDGERQEPWRPLRHSSAGQDTRLDPAACWVRRKLAATGASSGIKAPSPVVHNKIREKKRWSRDRIRIFGLV